MPAYFDVPILGVGTPDYTDAVSGAKERRGILLEYKQSLVLFSRGFSTEFSFLSYVRGPLTPGETDHLYNTSTGLAMPYTVPAGYGLSHVEEISSGTEDNLLEMFFDGSLVVAEIAESGVERYMHRVLAFSTLMLDPTAASHVIDLQFTNLGTGDLTGAISYLGILQAVGTEPLPNTKTVGCKFCGHQWIVPRETTSVNCPKCGKLNMYMELSHLKHSF